MYCKNKHSLLVRLIYNAVNPPWDPAVEIFGEGSKVVVFQVPYVSSLSQVETPKMKKKKVIKELEKNKKKQVFHRIHVLNLFS